MIQFFKALLREMRVLAMLTSQIATRTGNTEPEMARDKVVKRRFFNGADINHGRLTIDQSI